MTEQKFDSKKNQERLDEVTRVLSGSLRNERPVDRSNKSVKSIILDKSDQKRDSWGHMCDVLASGVAQQSAHFHKDSDGRADAGETALFATQLKHVIMGFFGDLYPSTEIRSWFPVDNNLPVGADRYAARRVQHFGEMGRVGGAGTNIPRHTLNSTEDTTPNVEYRGAFEWDLQQLERAAFGDFPLETQQMQNLAMSAERNFEKIAHSGDSAAGLIGYYTAAASSSIPLVAAVTGTWATATSDQILGDLRHLLHTIRSNTEVISILAPTILVVPSNRTEYLGARNTNTDNSVRTNLLAEFPNLRIVESFRADTLDAAGTGPRLLAGNAQQLASAIQEPRRMDALPPFQESPVSWIVVARQNLSGVRMSHPKSFAHMDGI